MELIVIFIFVFIWLAISLNHVGSFLEKRFLHRIQRFILLIELQTLRLLFKVLVKVPNGNQLCRRQVNLSLRFFENGTTWSKDTTVIVHHTGSVIFVLENVLVRNVARRLTYHAVWLFWLVMKMFSAANFIQVQIPRRWHQISLITDRPWLVTAVNPHSLPLRIVSIRLLFNDGWREGKVRGGRWGVYWLVWLIMRVGDMVGLHCFEISYWMTVFIYLFIISYQCRIVHTRY